MSTSSNSFANHLQDFNEDNNVLLSLLLTNSRLHLSFNATLETHSPINELRNAYLSLQQLHQFIHYLRTPSQDAPRENIKLALTLASHTATKLDNHLTSALNQLGTLDILIDVDRQLHLNSLPPHNVASSPSVVVPTPLPVPPPSPPLSYEERIAHLRAQEAQERANHREAFLNQTDPVLLPSHPRFNDTCFIAVRVIRRRTAASINAPNASALPLVTVMDAAPVSNKAPHLSSRCPPPNPPFDLAAPERPAPIPFNFPKKF